jgi:poly(3-hydroxybutyrate) depolymerase
MGSRVRSLGARAGPRALGVLTLACALVAGCTGSEEPRSTGDRAADARRASAPSPGSRASAGGGDALDATRDTATFVADTIVVDGHSYPCVIQLPPGYDDRLTWPAILALHGAGSRGRKGLRHRDQSIAAAARRYPDRYPAIVILPQIPLGRYWVGGLLGVPRAALARALERYPIDRRRIYVVGQSMGAGAVLRLIAADPDRFAAAVAAAAPGEPPPEATQLTGTPLWLFHGALDPLAVDPVRARVAAIREAGGEVRYTEYPDLGHDIFDQVYGTAEVPRWLLDHQLGP